MEGLIRMKLETIKKDTRKKWLGIIGVVLTLVVSYAFVGTKAKYRYTQSIDLVDGVINWDPVDLEIVSIKLEEAGGGILIPIVYPQVATF